MTRGARLAVFGLVIAALGLTAITVQHGLLRRLAGAAQAQVIPVTLTPAMIDPAVVLLLHPGPVRFIVRNSAATPRRFTVHGPGVTARTEELPPGAEAGLEVMFAHPGTYTLSGGAPGGDAGAGTLTVKP